MKGIVYLVGAGPGHEGLFTLQGCACLQKADCVVFDHLANDGLLRMSRPDAEWIDVGKIPGNHAFTQDQINRLLTDKARAGYCVVRLKGGDPFVFGRGGEEAVWLSQQGIPFEVVPGVSSAVAAAAWAGIPVTQRGMSSLVVVASGTTSGPDPVPYPPLPNEHPPLRPDPPPPNEHPTGRSHSPPPEGCPSGRGGPSPPNEHPPLRPDSPPPNEHPSGRSHSPPPEGCPSLRPDSPPSEGCPTGRGGQDWPRLARLEGTLVLLMAMNTLSRIVEELIRHGKDPATPTAVIRQATTADQQVVTGSLAEIAEKSRQAGLSNPAVVVMGEVVTLREVCAWWEQKPLAGKRIILVGSNRVLDTPPDHPLHRLGELGAEVLLRPLIRISTDQSAVSNYFQQKRDSSTLVFLSRNAVGAFWEGLRTAGQDIRSLAGKAIVAIGEETARELQTVGIAADLVPARYHSKDLAERMSAWDRLSPITLITSDKGGRSLREELHKTGFRVEIVSVCRNQTDLRYRSIVQRDVDRRIDIAVFTSPSAFYAWRELAQEQSERLKTADILTLGPVTRKAIEEEGYPVAFSPKVHTLGGLVEEWLEEMVEGLYGRRVNG